MIKRSLLALSLLVILSVVPVGRAAAQTSERITDFASNITLGQDGFASITETINYDFGTADRHGIFREIPLQYQVVDDRGYQLEATVLSVSRDGLPEQFSMSGSSPSYSNVKIGDPDTTITGLHEYRLEYMLGPVIIESDDGFDIVRLDIPGTGWSVPIDHASALVTYTDLPSNSICYEGYTGFTAQTCVIEQVGTSTSFSTSKSLAIGQTMTVETAFPSNTFSSHAQLATLQSASESLPVQALAFIGIMLSVILIGIGKPAIGKMRYLRRRKQEIVIPQYEPPKNMGPAELGLLIDNSSSGAELSATLINLAVNGFIKIVQTKEKKWYRNARYNFLKLKPADSKIKPYEKEIFNALFSKGDTVDSSDLARSSKFRSANLAFHKQLVKNLKTQGFYKKVNVFKSDLASRMTDGGYKKWAEVDGFREFLQLTEADRLAFTDAPSKKPEQFSQFLPYAIAIGVEKEWADQFKDLSVNVNDWYQSNSLASDYNLARMSSSLSRGLGSVSASANRSSGSSGVSSGFSGGGFSGGGGGSW